MGGFLRSRIRKHLPVIIFLCIYFLVISYKLITVPTPFFDWDESINVQVGREMVEKGSVVPLWQNNVWLDKPPLPFLLFGLIMKLTPFTIPEISLRITALILSIIALLFIYALFLRSAKDKLIAFVSVVITSFIPIFLQRSQVLNLDVFILIGWVGYVLFFSSFYVSLFFLSVAVLTKSLIGFYPLGILLGYYLFLLLVKRIKIPEFKKVVTKLLLHGFILSLWYLIMLIIFGNNFWQQHMVESHFNRVTASIESHFGKRTYYLDLLMEQIGIFLIPSLLGLLIMAVTLLQNIKKGKNYEDFFYGFFLIPWFLFLNLTKTKIFWYIYPAIPQFAFLASYPLNLVKKNKIVYYMLALPVVGFVFYQNFIQTNFFSTLYSKPEDHYRLALYAKQKCNFLTVLVGKDTREATNTLEKMGLTISSTKQWGDHPSLVYYFGKKVNFLYEESQLLDESADCLVLSKSDLSLNRGRKKELVNFGQLYLLK